MNSTRPSLFRFLPTAVDLLTGLGYFIVVPWVGRLIFDQSAWNHAILLPGFILMIAGIVLVQMLPTYSFKKAEDANVLAVCLAFFVVIVYSMLYASSTNLGGSGKANDTVAAIIFSIYLLPFLGAFFVEAKRTQAETRKAYLVESASLGIVNYLSLIGASVLYCFSLQESSSSGVQATGISFLVLYLVMFVLFLVFFGLPRIYLLLATGNRTGFGFYLASTALFVWTRVPSL